MWWATSKDELIDLFTEASRQRHSRPTDMNPQSSRGHGCLTLVLLARQQACCSPREGEEEASRSVADDHHVNFSFKNELATHDLATLDPLSYNVLSLVDLAGGEKPSTTDEMSRQEGISNNQGIMTLRAAMRRLKESMMTNNNKLGL